MIVTNYKDTTKVQDKNTATHEYNFSLQTGGVKPYDIAEMTGSKSSIQVDSTSQKED